MAAVKKMLSKSCLRSILIYAFLVACFLLFCIRAKIIGDYAEAEYDSISVRCLFIAVISLFIAFRLKGPLPFGSNGFFRKLAIICIFISVLFYPVISHVSFLEKSTRDVRHGITAELKGKPNKLLALLRYFPSEYEKYANKNFEFSTWFVHLDALYKVYLLGVSPNNNVAVGKNGFYFEGWGARKVEKGIVENFDNIADYMGQIPFTEKDLKQWKRTLEERKYWLRERGSEYVFVLAPTKALVYPEYLPSSLQRALEIGATTRYSQLTDYLTIHTDVHFIDVLPALLEAKKQRSYPLLFYKTDFHWNFYGAFITYRTIVSRLSEIFPQYGLEPPDFSEFDFSVDEHWAHHRFMNMIGLPSSMHKNEHYFTLIPRPGGRWDSAQDIPEEGIHDVYPPKRTITAEDGTSMEIRMLLNPEAKIPSILMLGDSFFEKCVYFFSGDAQKVMNYRTIVNFPKELFHYERPDIVIQEILNMFILRPPPTNPRGFYMSYLRGKFADSSDNVIVKKIPDQLVESAGRIEIELDGSLSGTQGGVQILKLVVDAGSKQKVLVRFLDDHGQVLEANTHTAGKGRTDIYQEIAGQLPHLVIISEQTDNSTLHFSVDELEIRSDES